MKFGFNECRTFRRNQDKTPFFHQSLVDLWDYVRMNEYGGVTVIGIAKHGTGEKIYFAAADNYTFTRVHSFNSHGNGKNIFFDCPTYVATYYYGCTINGHINNKEQPIMTDFKGDYEITIPSTWAHKNYISQLVSSCFGFAVPCNGEDTKVLVTAEQIGRFMAERAILVKNQPHWNLSNDTASMKIKRHGEPEFLDLRPKS